MSGANYDILAKGLIDKQLSGNPTHTFWRSTWKRHTLFSIESLGQPFNTSTNFGQESQVLLNRVGDMVYFLYVHVKLLPQSDWTDVMRSYIHKGMMGASG